MTREELLKEATIRYPKGTKVKTWEVPNRSWNRFHPYVTSDGTFELDYWSDSIGILDGKIHLELFNNNRWAEIYVAPIIPVYKPILYLQKEAFEAGRKVIDIDSDIWLYKTFNDYLKSVEND